MTHTQEERDEMMAVIQDMIKQMDEWGGSDIDQEHYRERIEQMKEWMEE